MWKPGTMLLSQYEFIRELGEGGMGTVYLVRDCQAKPSQVDLYAIKTFKAPQELEDLQYQKVKTRFIHEAYTWIKLGQHPNLVMAQSVQEIDGQPYIFMEYVDGLSLHQWYQKAYALGIKQEDMIAAVLNFAIQFCTGMEHALQQIPDLVHLDIKPSNALISRELVQAGTTIVPISVLKITDWGIAKAFEELPARSCAHLEYTAPERFIHPADVTTQTDIYSFGVMLYELLTDRRPFEASLAAHIMDPSGQQRFKELRHKHLYERPKPPRNINSAIPEELETLILDCLQKDPKDRPVSFTQVKERLLKIFEAYTGQEYRLYLASPQGGWQELYNWGIGLVELGKYEEAERYLRDAVKSQPKAAAPWLGLGYLHEQQGLYREAVKCYYRALKYNKDHANAWNNLGVVLGRCKHPLWALRCFDQALRIKPEYDYAWNNKGWRLLQLGRVAEALDCINKALEINPRLQTAWNNKGVLLADLWRRDRREEDFQMALRCFDQALSINPRYTEALTNKGGLLYQKLNYVGALECAERALTIDDAKNYAAWNLKGSVLQVPLYARHDPKEAIRCFEKALDLNPKGHEAHNNLGNLLLDIAESEKMINEAIDHLERAVALKPDEPRYQNDLGRAYERIGEYSKAISHVQKAAKLDPANSVYQDNLSIGWGKLGISLHEKGQYEEAVKAYQEAIRLWPDYAKHYHNLALAQIKLKKLDEAIKNCIKAIELDPSNAVFHYDLGNIYWEQQELALAAACFQKAIQLNPDLWGAYNNLGAVYTQKKWNAAAISCFQKALSKSSNQEEIWISQHNLKTTRSTQRFPLSQESAVCCIALGATGRFLWLGEREQMKIWDLQSNQCLAAFPAPWYQQQGNHLYLQKALCSENGQYFVAAGGHTIFIYRLGDREVLTLRLGVRIIGISLSPDGRYLAIQQPGLTRVWDTHQSEIIQSFPSDSISESAVPFSSEGRLIALPQVRKEKEGTIIEVRELPSGKFVQSLHLGREILYECRFNRKGDALITLSVIDKPFTLGIWDLNTGKLQEAMKVKGPEDGIHDQVFSMYGSYWAGVRDEDWIVEIFVTSLQETITLEEAQGKLSFSPNECYLSALGRNSEICLWELGTSLIE